MPCSLQTEAAELARCDVGIMPLPDAPWERGKCGYKLIQYMASGLPVVASPIGANREIVIPGETGFLAAGSEEWAEGLSRLFDDPGLRARMGAAGRAGAERLYSVGATAPRLAQLLHRATRIRGAGRAGCRQYAGEPLDEHSLERGLGSRLDL